MTSRDAAALLGVPEPQVRQLIRDGTLPGFRAGGYWIASGAAVAQYAASAEGALARLRTDFPGWRTGALSWRYFAIADRGPGAGRVVFTARTVEELRRKLENWQAVRAPVDGPPAPAGAAAGGSTPPAIPAVSTGRRHGEPPAR